MKRYKKYLFLFILIFSMIISVNAASVFVNYNTAVSNTDTYITNFSKYKLFIDSTNKYLYNGNSLTTMTGFKNGGFLNTYEFNSSKNSSGDSYLITGARYWTMTTSNNTVDVVNVKNLESSSKANSLESRITELIIPETRVTGVGTRDNPWLFIIPEFKITINLVNATIGGNSTMEEVVIGYNKTYTITPNQSYYIFKNLDGDLVCDKTIGSYKIQNNKLILDDLKGDGSCTVRYRGKSVTANINVSNGTAGSTKLTGEAGDDLSTTLAANSGYAYDSVSCTNSQKATYSTKKLTVNKIISDTTCTVVYGKPSDKTYTFVAGNQTYTVAYSGYYDLDVYGAQGGNSGGKGSRVRGTVYLNKGDVLTINTGGYGGNTNTINNTTDTTRGYNGGGKGYYYGGGASTVKNSGVTLIAAAGGGGGSAGTAGGNGTAAGGTSSGGSGTNGGAGTAGTNSGGGGSGYNYSYQTNCSSCYYGSNTCSGGYVNTNCSNCYTQERVCQGGYVSYNYGGGSGSVCTTCHNGKYGSSYNSTDNVNCGSDRKVWSCGSWPACGNSGRVCKSCSGYCVGSRYDSCASYDWECQYGCDRVYDSCATGSNTCSYGCDNRTVSYNSGEGGTSRYSSTIKKVSESYGNRSGHGQVIVKFHGEEL